MAQLKSTIKFSMLIMVVVMLTFITIVGLIKQEWMGTELPEQAENQQSRIDNNKEPAKTNKITEDADKKLINNLLEPEIDKKEQPGTINFRGRIIKEGDIIRLYNVYFDLNQSKLKPESDKEILQMIDLLKKYPGLHVEISGHTSKTQSKEYSINLSKKRAEAVFQYVTSHGIEKNRLKIVGYGFEKPVSAGNDSLDRRVEFKVLKI